MNLHVYRDMTTDNCSERIYLKRDIMGTHFIYFINTFIKFFILLTPFFALSAFLAMTSKYSEHQRKKLALKITLSVSVVALVIFFFGNYIFLLVGITINSFRIGAGALLFLTAISLVQGKQEESGSSKTDDIVVVPLSIPIIAGPATIGSILVLSADLTGFTEKALSLSALLSAIICVGLILVLSTSIERVLKKKGIIVLSKITGLILAALSAEMIFTGIRSFLK